MQKYSPRDTVPLTVDEKKFIIEEEIVSIKEQYDFTVIEKKKIEQSLADYRAIIRTNGMMDDKNYVEIVEKQNKLKQKQKDFEYKLIDLKGNIRRLETEKERLRVLGKKTSISDTKDQLVQIKNKYISFAADQSRVSSMRTMAAKFAEELETIISKL